MKRTAKNVSLFKLIDEAEVFLTTTKHTFALHKWETEAWGENPADFGRK
jgi:ribonuclease HI